MKDILGALRGLVDRFGYWLLGILGLGLVGVLLALVVTLSEYQDVIDCYQDADRAATQDRLNRAQSTIDTLQAQKDLLAGAEQGDYPTARNAFFAKLDGQIGAERAILESNRVREACE